MEWHRLRAQKTNGQQQSHNHNNVRMNVVWAHLYDDMIWFRSGQTRSQAEPGFVTAAQLNYDQDKNWFFTSQITQLFFHRRASEREQAANSANSMAYNLNKEAYYNERVFHFHLTLCMCTAPPVDKLAFIHKPQRTATLFMPARHIFMHRVSGQWHVCLLVSVCRLCVYDDHIYRDKVHTTLFYCAHTWAHTDNSVQLLCRTVHKLKPKWRQKETHSIVIRSTHSLFRALMTATTVCHRCKAVA